MEKFQGCPGSRMMNFKNTGESNAAPAVGKITSQLTQWPIQMHLINPAAPYYQGADVLLTADCVAYALGDFHRGYLKDRSIAIACPKLDQGREVYQQKLTALVDEAQINSLTVMTMQVPCCAGLLHLAKTAVAQAERQIPILSKVVSVRGEILSEEWI